MGLTRAGEKELFYYTELGVVQLVLGIPFENENLKITSTTHAFKVLFLLARNLRDVTLHAHFSFIPALL